MNLENYDDEYSPTAAEASRTRQADPAAAEWLAQARAESQRLRRQIVADARAQAAPMDSRGEVAKALSGSRTRKDDEDATGHARATSACFRC